MSESKPRFPVGTRVRSFSTRELGTVIRVFPVQCGAYVLWDREDPCKKIDYVMLHTALHLLPLDEEGRTDEAEQKTVQCTGRLVHDTSCPVHYGRE